MNNTDRAWKEWGDRDPYYGVLSQPQFRRSELNEHSLQKFFLTGEEHVDHVVGVLRQHLRPAYEPQRILDYGCGVGRLVIPFAERFEHVTGIDVSPSMLEEASRNADKRNLQNVQFLSADELDSLPAESFDLVHSFIVFQHIPVNRGEVILEQLLRILKRGGLGAVHVTFSRNASPARRMVAALRKRSGIVHRALNLVQGRPFSEPPMQMNAYSLSNIYNILFSGGCGSIYSEFSCHDDVRGVMLYFEKYQPAHR